MAKASELLAAAVAELGTKESPANSNNVKYNTWYYGRAVFGSAYPWCMVFIQWCFNQIGARKLLPLLTASCSALMNAAKSTGCWVTKDFRPGDVVIYDFPGGAATDHCGIVERVTASGVVAIEGNTSSDEAGSQSNGGMVCRKTRPYKYVVGVVRPAYEEDDMDISKLTDEQVVQLANRINEVMGRQEVSAKLAPELAEAQTRGITDGSRPGAFATREQAAVMVLRSMKNG